LFSSPLAIVTLAAVVGACAAEPPGGGGTVPRDSAGITIIENRQPLRPSDSWRLDVVHATPVDLPGPGVEVTAMAAFPGGRFALADAHGGLTWYDPRGRPVHRAWLPDSPYVSALFALRDGAAVAWDGDRGATARVTVNGRRGEWQSHGALEGSPAALGAFADGSLLVSVRDARLFRVSERPVREAMPLVRLGPGAARAQILSVPGPEELTWGGPRGAVRIPAPFARDAFVAVADDRVWVADAMTGELRSYTAAGRLRSIVRAPVHGDSAQAADVTEWRGRLRRLAHGYLASDELARLEASLPIPSTWPPFTKLLASPRGELWVRAGTAPGDSARWNVFAADGRWLGELRVGPAVQITAVGDGYALAQVQNRWILLALP
jgi:hypothetical protein